MRKKEPEVEDKMQGIAFARAYNKLRNFARSLNWEIRLRYRNGGIEIERTEDDRAVMRYVVAGEEDDEISLSLNPHTSQAVLRSAEGTFAYPIYDRYVIEDRMEGIDNALDDVRAEIRRLEKKPKMLKICLR